MPIDVCICTHNPRLEVFTLILTAIANQTLSKDDYQVWIIDNASNPAISDSDLTPLKTAGITYQLLSEPRLGIMYARELAGQAVTGDTVLFVDDDNELMPNYLEIAVNILESHPEIGFFGGKLLSDIKIDYPQWMNELSGYLGIKDCGDEAISKCLEGDYRWGEWEPPTAGGVVRKQVLQKYFETLRSMPLNLVIGRQGNRGLLSSEDSLIAKCCYDLGFACAYQPRLQLIHHINEDRLQFGYFVRFLFNYGRSYVLLRKAIKQCIEDNIFVSIAIAFKNWTKKGFSIRYLICLLAREVGFLYELWRPERVVVDRVTPNKLI
jgi:glycosyltransferase involved in cell wall biosynthesis